METTHTVEAPATRASTWLTVLVGACVAAVALAFALNATDAHSHVFAVFKLIHVGVAVFWVGGGVLLTVLAMGITMVINHHIGFGTTWVDIGLTGYALSFTTGIAVLAPLTRRIVTLSETAGPTAPETQDAIRRILLIARVDTGVLLLVIADMLMKPFS